MLISDAIKSCLDTELSTHGISRKELSESVPIVTRLFNQAVIAITKKANLRQTEIILNDTDDQTSNGVYLLPDNLLSISNITDEDGNDVPINDKEKINSVFTQSHNELMVPYDMEKGFTLFIVYNSYPDSVKPVFNDDYTDFKIVTEDEYKRLMSTDPEETLTYDTATDLEFPISIVFFDSVLAYITYKLFSPVGSKVAIDGGQPDPYYIRYLNSIKEAIESGHGHIDNMNASTWFNRGGWK
jgi:hypothetical protein